MRKLVGLSLAVFLGGCSTVHSWFSSPPKTNVFIVYFDPASSALSPEAKTAVDGAAGAIKATHPQHVTVAVYMRKGTADPANPDLSGSRYDAVANELIAGGVDVNTLARATLTDEDVKADAAGNRRVEIRLYAN